MVPVPALDVGRIRAAAKIDTDVRTHTGMLILLAIRPFLLIASRLQALFRVNPPCFILLNGESTSLCAVSDISVHLASACGSISIRFPIPATDLEQLIARRDGQEDSGNICEVDQF